MVNTKKEIIINIYMKTFSKQTSNRCNKKLNSPYWERRCNVRGSIQKDVLQLQHAFSKKDHQ